MPGLDRTGPQGQGSRTGRGLGRCNPNNEISADGLPLQRGLRRGQGRGWRNRAANQDMNANSRKGFGRGAGRQPGQRGR